MKIREAAVAGMFYEADEQRLRQHLASLLGGAPQYRGDSPRALIVPHAGYVYSGAVAARAYASLAPVAEAITRVVLFGPAHRVALEGMAVPDVDAFATPLGAVPLDREAIQEASTLPGVCVSNEAHRLEHSLEVQLPFLQTVLGPFSLVPVVVGQCAASTVAAAVDALWGGPETLMVVSSDLSHFLNYAEARARDAHTCKRLVQKDSALNGRDACGAYALNGLMRSVHCQPLAVEELAMCNSGDTTGSKDRVVGYGAFVLH
jgi:AmmeMemoRadiSam system protein B